MMSEQDALRFPVKFPMPYFAEIPYYLWGQVNYDSEGDCAIPTDRNWTWLLLTHRDTNEEVHIIRTENQCEVSQGTEQTCEKLRAFLSATIDPSLGN